MMRAAEVRHNSIVGEVRGELTSAIRELNSLKEKLEKASQQAQYFSAQLLTTQDQLRKAGETAQNYRKHAATVTLQAESALAEARHVHAEETTLLRTELESQRASSASLALAGGDAAAWTAERRRLMKLFKEAIEHSEAKEMEHAAHIQNLNTKYEYE
eukprot:11183494-Lingulodinium_polyedra.AAC.1